ncbi:hypothetical protein F511_18338 [Dorcoceras hygrometricum]|uniref:Uncharacterized protein n=1 Tax=Dorcoceras hygrometricum TaxID=472368 RepID=A0A2Z7C5W4_9LAMI|nr:hypothetical protein F511_18338 [Dorcoceras hygrometricum]
MKSQQWISSFGPGPDGPPPSSPRTRRRRRRPRTTAAADRRRKIVSGQLDEENPFVLISSTLLVQPDEGVSDLVVDRIGDNLPQSTEKSRIIVIPVGARHKCQQGNPPKRPIIRKQNCDSATGPPPCAAAHPLKRTSARDSRTWLYTSRALADASARCCASRRSCFSACRRSWLAVADLLCSLVARDRGQRLARDDGRCPSQGGARDIAQRCDVEAPLLARWPDDVDRSDLIGDRSYDEVAAMDIVIWTRARWAGPSPFRPSSPRTRRRPRTAAAADRRRKIVSGQFDDENPFVLILSALLVQPDEGVSDLVVDRIGDNLPQSTEKSRIIVIPVGARHKCQQDAKHDTTRCFPTHEMWELPTPLIVANRSQQGDEVRELPTQPQQHPGTHRDQQQQGKLDQI